MQDKLKILLIRNDHIGDLVYSTPVFRELKKAMPNCEITALVSPENKPIIEKNPYIDKILEINIPAYSFKSILSYWKMSRKIRNEEFDIGIDLRGSVQNSFFLLWLAGIKKRISHIEWHPVIKHFLTTPLVFDKKAHIFEDNAAFLAEFGIKRHNNWPEIHNTKKDREEIDEIIYNHNLNKFICILPCAGLPEKQWSMDNFKNLMKIINNNHPEYKVVLIGLEKDKDLLEELQTSTSIMLLDINVRRLPLLFNKSALVIAHDGGPMHAGWLMGANTLALYPAEVADKFIPLKNCKTFISKSKLNMDSITLDEVAKAVGDVL